MSKSEKRKNWGEEIWEEKAVTQGEIGVIHGVEGSEKSIKESQAEVMENLDSEFLPLVKGKKALDAGVGPLARYSIEFRRKGYDVTGVDISETTLKFAKKNIEKEGYKGIKLVKDDLVELKKIKGKYDLVFCIGTFGHIPSFLALNTLKSFNRVLKKEGFCIVDIWMKEELNFSRMMRGILYNSARLIKKKFKKTFDVNCSTYTLGEISEMAKMSGFRIIKRKENFFLLKKI